MGVQNGADPTFNYNNTKFKDLWNDMGEGFFNFGRISPKADISKIPDLNAANRDMADYIIQQLHITRDSHILDLGCGPGMYTVYIAEKTGCRFLGTDINDAYLEKARSLAERAGVAERGAFIKSSWQEVNPELKSAKWAPKFTHILTLGSLYYGHDILGKIFKDLAELSNPETKVFVWDFVRKSPWNECVRAQRHLKMNYPIASLAEIFEALNSSDLVMFDFEDVTQYIIPSYKIIARECKARDPELKTLTHGLLGEDLMDDKVSYIVYYLKLQKPRMQQ